MANVIACSLRSSRSIKSSRTSLACPNKLNGGQEKEMINRNVTRVIVAVLMVCVLILTSVLGACAKPTPGEFLLRSQVNAPPTSPFAVTYDLYLDEIENRTNGRVVFERYYEGGLAPFAGIADAVAEGVADLAQCSDFFQAGKFPLGHTASLPGSSNDLWAALMAFNELQKMPELQAEHTNLNLKYLAPCVLHPFYIMSKEPIETMADLEGMKIRGVGTQAQVLEGLGATAVNIPTEEMYLAIERGTIDAITNNYPGFVGYGIHEICKYVFTLNTGQPMISIKMNLDTWNKLPADIQKIFDEVAIDHIETYMQSYIIAGQEDALQQMEEANVQIVEASAADQAQVVEVAKEEIWKQWVQDREADGIPAGKVLDAWLELVAKYEAQSPYK